MTHDEQLQSLRKITCLLRIARREAGKLTAEHSKVQNRIYTALLEANQGKRHEEYCVTILGGLDNESR